MKVENNGRSAQSTWVATFHLTPEPVWLEQRLLAEYRPEGFRDEGLIHCAGGEALVPEVASRYARDDPRLFLRLEFDPDRVSAPAISEDDERNYSQIHGPIERDAVRHEHRLERAADGTFVAIGEPAPEHL